MKLIKIVQAFRKNYRQDAEGVDVFYFRGRGLLTYEGKFIEGKEEKFKEIEQFIEEDARAEPCRIRGMEVARDGEYQWICGEVDITEEEFQQFLKEEKGFRAVEQQYKQAKTRRDKQLSSLTGRFTSKVYDEHHKKIAEQIERRMREMNERYSPQSSLKLS